MTRLRRATASRRGPRPCRSRPRRGEAARAAAASSSAVPSARRARSRRRCRAPRRARPARARMTSAPSRSSALVPALRGAVTGPGTAPTAPAEVLRELGRDERARALRRLDDDRQRRQPGDDAVARREAPAQRREPRRHLGDRGLRAHDRAVQRALARRVRDVGAAGEHASVGPPPRARRRARPSRCRAPSR